MIRAVTFDAYGTLLRNEDLRLIPRRIVADHGLSVPSDDLLRIWIDLYFEATQSSPFRTLREIQAQVLHRVLRQFGVGADAAPYVDLFFQVTTNVELYPEALEVLEALGDVPSAIVSNADQEHLAAWNFSLPVRFILISEAVRAYKPNQVVFARAVEQLGLQPHEVLHVGDSLEDDVIAAQRAGLQSLHIGRKGSSELERRSICSLLEVLDALETI